MPRVYSASARPGGKAPIGNTGNKLRREANPSRDLNLPEALNPSAFSKNNKIFMIRGVVAIL